jgi:hypothetical protein
MAKTKVNIIALTAANIVAQKAAVAALANAESGLTSGEIASSDIGIQTGGSGIYPTVIANRGQKWIITAANSVDRRFTYTIPAGIFEGNVQSDNYTADLTSTAWAAFVTAFQGVAVDPNGDSLSLVSARVGGRRR